MKDKTDSATETFLVEIPEDIVQQGLDMCPLKTLAEIEDEFNEWLSNIGIPDSIEGIIEKYLFFCRIKGEAINL
jgi:hypothetical protein